MVLKADHKSTDKCKIKTCRGNFAQQREIKTTRKPFPWPFLIQL